MALGTCSDPRLKRPLAASLLDHAESSPDVTAMFLPEGAETSVKTWRQLADDVLRLAASLDGLGIKPGDRIVHWSDNRYEWIVIDLAIQLVGAIHIPLHGSLPAAAAAAQIEHAEPRLIIVATAAMAEGLRDFAAACGAAGDSIEVIDATEQAPALLDRVKAATPAQGMAIVQRRLAKFDPQAIATILYSSGTSGEPKAVALSHANLSSNALTVIDILGETPEERRLNFLPLSHIYARTCDFYTWLAGGSQIVLARSRDTIFADSLLTEPTLINAVPYFYQRLSLRISEAEAAGTTLSIQELLGPNIRACMCGGAALPVETFDFFQSRGIPILPGYGLTESSPVIAVSTPSHLRRGTVGRAIAGIEVRIADDGELLTRGPHVMLEYWKDPQLTRVTIRDGWLYTGDLGSIDDDGYISITGRKKEMIVLSTGKKAIPTHIEGLLCREPLILQALVVGNDQTHLAALIVPNFEQLAAWRQAQGLSELSHREALSDPAVAREYQERIAQILSGLPPYEQVKRFRLLERPFTIEDGLLTPKLSMRRDVIQRRYQDEIASLYAGGGAGVEYGYAAVAAHAS